MGVDTKLYVEVQDHMADRIDVIKRAGSAIEKKIYEHLDEEVQRRGYKNRLHMLFNLKDSEKGTWTNGFGQFSTYGFNMFTVNFGYKGERRNLSCFIDCDCDMEEYSQAGGVIFSLGCWGSSDEIMRAIIDELRNDFRMWYEYNDCSGDVEKVGNHG